jgi:hypothetical protein
MEFFLNSDHCPNFVKADVEKAKIHVDNEPINNEDENDQFNSSVFDNSIQPEWMELVHLNKQFEEIDSDFSFDNGGPDFDWSKTSYEYPNDLGKAWLEKKLDIPEVDISNMNSDQRFPLTLFLK